MKWKVVVDIAPRIVKGTNGCHQFVYGYYKTKKRAESEADEINSLEHAGKARVERCEGY